MITSKCIGHSLLQFCNSPGSPIENLPSSHRHCGPPTHDLCLSLHDEAARRWIKAVSSLSLVFSGPIRTLHWRGSRDLNFASLYRTTIYSIRLKGVCDMTCIAEEYCSFHRIERRITEPSLDSLSSGVLSLKKRHSGSTRFSRPSVVSQFTFFDLGKRKKAKKASKLKAEQSMSLFLKSTIF